MSHPISDRTASVLIVDPNQIRRSSLANGIKREGFAQVHSTPSTKDAMSFLEAESVPPDWIVTGLGQGEPMSAFHLLTLLIDQKQLRGCRLSLILGPGELFCLPRAFAMGLWSWHVRFPDLSSQLAALMDIVTVGEESGWDDCLVAAHYLREHLKDDGRLSDLERLEQRLLTFYPNTPDLVVRFAEALFLRGKGALAQTALDNIKDATQEIEARIASLSARIAASSERTSADEPIALAKSLRFQRCMIVDPDEAARNQVAEALRMLGAQEIYECADGDEAWLKLKSKAKAPDLMIQEWRLPRLGGDMLVQRLRLTGRAALPVVVFSSLVKNKDRLLLREMGVTDVIEKPMAASKLANAIASVMRNERRPETPAALERQVRVALACRDQASARRLLASCPQDDKDIDLIRVPLEAELALQAGDLKLALDLATKARYLSGEDVFALNLLGKIHLKLGQAKEAVRYFDAAERLSPKNISRLLFLAEAHVALDQGDKAGQAIDKAKALDSGNVRVLEAEAKVALAAGDEAKAAKAMARIGSTPGIVAFINNRAVALVSQQRTRESVDLYRRALTSLPATSKKTRAILHYNLALGFLRIGDIEAAHHVFGEGSRGADESVAKKFASLAARTAKSLETGEPLHLQSEGQRIEEKDGELSATEAGMNAVTSAAQAGTMCLYMIFEEEGPSDPKTAKLLPTTKVAFKERGPIKKGAENASPRRVNKQAS